MKNLKVNFYVWLVNVSDLMHEEVNKHLNLLWIVLLKWSSHLVAASPESSFITREEEVRTKGKHFCVVDLVYTNNVFTSVETHEREDNQSWQSEIALTQLIMNFQYAIDLSVGHNFHQSIAAPHSYCSSLQDMIDPTSIFTRRQHQNFRKLSVVAGLYLSCWEGRLQHDKHISCVRAMADELTTDDKAIDKREAAGGWPHVVTWVTVSFTNVLEGNKSLCRH